MNYELRSQFFTAMASYKKIELAFSSQCNIPLNELAILQRITGGCEHDECNSMNLNAAEIQQKLHITKAAVSYILNALEKKGYITREIDSDDRRKISMKATAEGKLAVEQFSTKLDDLWNLLLASFGEEQMEQLVESLTHLTTLCEEILG